MPRRRRTGSAHLGRGQRLAGRGRRETFEDRGPDGTGDGQYQAPAGRFAELIKSTTGYRLVESNHTTFRFDTHGRLVTIEDPLRTTKERGNTIRFVYDVKSRLVDVVDDLERGYRLSYDGQGRLATVTDFGGREVAFGYDPAGRLTSARSPRVTTGHSPFPDGITTGFEYSAAGSGDLASRLARRDNLTALREGRGLTWLELGWDNDEGGRAEAVGTQTWGGFPLSIAYDWIGRETVVTDRRAASWISRHNEAGQVTARLEPTEEGAATWAFEHDEEGLVTHSVAPLGRETTVSYDEAGLRRSRGNVLSTSVVADGRGPNGSPGTITSSAEYDSKANSPTRIVASDGTLTEIERDEWGQARVIREAVGSLVARVSELEYDERGRVTSSTNANGHLTEYHYAESGTDRGYLERIVVDPDELGITTRLESDARGNVLATIDPRGVRHEASVDELDRVAEVRAAVTGAGADAPALGYVTTYQYDAGGRPTRVEVPVGDGSARAATTTVYGLLGEVRRVEREIEAGGATLATSIDYDPGYLPVRTTDPAGRVIEQDFDPRGQVKVTRKGLGANALAAPMVEQRVYDLEGGLIRVVDGESHAWVTERDGFGRVKESRDPLGNRQLVEYDALGRPTAERAEASSGELLAHATTLYDELSRVRESSQLLWSPSSTDSSVPTRRKLMAIRSR